MAKDLQESLAAVLGTVVEEASKNLISSSRSGRSRGANGVGSLSGAKGVIAGAGAAAAAPVAIKGARKLMNGLNGVGNVVEAPGKLASKLASGVGSGIGDKLGTKLDESGGPSGVLKDTVKEALPFGGGGGATKGKGGVPGVGTGRRMPVQQSVDIGLPIETVYNQWTQFEEWPNFMHRVTRVTQDDDCTVSFATKIWGKTKEFTAKIETQRPDERVKWSVTEGMTHTGVVTFHELAPRLTRVLLGFDVDPGSLIEKLARGSRHVKRAARADLHRFKAFIETQEHETGAWRGRIEDGEVVEEHDPGYDEGREYARLEGDQPEQRGGGKSRGNRRSGRQSGQRSAAQGRRTGSRARGGGDGGSEGRGRASARSGSRSSSSGSRSGSSGSRSGSSRSGSSGRSRASTSRAGARSSSGSSRSGSRRSSASSRTRASSSGRSGSQRSQADGRG
jgi:uncharacterized membrane protein